MSNYNTTSNSVNKLGRLPIQIYQNGLFQYLHPAFTLPPLTLSFYSYCPPLEQLDTFYLNYLFFRNICQTSWIYLPSSHISGDLGVHYTAVHHRRASCLLLVLAANPLLTCHSVGAWEPTARTQERQLPP